MKSRIIKVTSGVDGRERDALLVICPDCDGEEFLIYYIGGSHHHLECTRCGHSFCEDGVCDKAAETLAKLGVRS